MRTLVLFIRDNHEDDDIARENYPHLPLEAALVQQFKAELDQNPVLRGRWRTLDTQVTNTRTLAWVQFQHLSDHDGHLLYTELQRTYDEHGMNGRFEIVCATADSGRILDHRHWSEPPKTVEQLITEDEED